MDALARADGKDKGCRIGSREVSRVTREDARSMNCWEEMESPVDHIPSSRFDFTNCSWNG